MPCRLATAATGSRSPSRMIATICSSEKRPFRIAPSESGASLSTYRWSENPGAPQWHVRACGADYDRPRVPEGRLDAVKDRATAPVLKRIKIGASIVIAGGLD